MCEVSNLKWISWPQVVTVAYYFRRQPLWTLELKTNYKQFGGLPGLPSPSYKTIIRTFPAQHWRCGVNQSLTELIKTLELSDIKINFSLQPPCLSLIPTADYLYNIKPILLNIFTVTLGHSPSSHEYTLVCMQEDFCNVHHWSNLGLKLIVIRTHWLWVSWRI